MSDGAWRTLPWWLARPTRLRHRIGRRGSALLVFAFVDLIIGWSLIDPTGQAQARALASYRGMMAVCPLPVWGGLWILVGLVCAVSAFARRDAAGYFAAIGIKVVWAGCFAASWLIWEAPRGWLGAVTWCAFAALVYLIAGWPEPLPAKEPVDPL